MEPPLPRQQNPSAAFADPVPAIPVCAEAVGAAPTLGEDAGQATAEYALVLLGAAAIALLLVRWATHTGALTDLFDAVIAQIRHRL